MDSLAGVVCSNFSVVRVFGAVADLATVLSQLPEPSEETKRLRERSMRVGFWAGRPQQRE